VIAGAKITLLGQDTGVTRRTTSRQDGTFILEDVSPAGYVLRVEMSGFETYQKALAVGPNRRKPLRIRLRVSAVEEDVTVEAEIDRQAFDIRKRRRHHESGRRLASPIFQSPPTIFCL